MGTVMEKNMSRKIIKFKRTDAPRQEPKLHTVAVIVSVGTAHQKELCLSDGTIDYLYPDGRIEKTDRLWHYAMVEY